VPQRHQIGFRASSTNTTFYTLEDVRIEATLRCAKIGLGSDTITDTQATRLNPQQHVKAVELLLACLLVDNTAMAHLPGPQNPGMCHLYLVEGCHLYIALTRVVGAR
jgi:hypothetical protein